MKKHLLLSLLLFFIFITNSFGQITFQESVFDFGPGNYGYVYDIKQTYDSGYIVTGSFPIVVDTFFLQSFLMKFDRNGDTVWTKYLNSPAAGVSVLEACDDGYITSGQGISKTDSAGNLLWSKYYPSVEYGGDIAKTNDCGYILASVTDSFGAGGNDIYVIKTDSVGNPLWSKTYGGSGDDEPTSIQQTDDGGYIIAGNTTSFNKGGNYYAYLIKTDSNGDTLWTKTYGPYYEVSYSYSAQQTYDHGYILLGDYLIKTDSMGNVMWSNTLGGYSIQQTLDSGYIFLSGGIPVSLDVFLIKTNSSGNPLWARDFYAPLNGDISGGLVLQTHDGGYIAADYVTIYYGAEYEWGYTNIIKTNAKGQSGCNEIDTTVYEGAATIKASSTATIVTAPVTTVIDTTINLVSSPIMPLFEECYSDGISEVHSENSITLYPNPATNQLTIHTSSFHNEAVTVSIMNVLGQETSPPTPLLQERGEAVIDIGKLSSGMYFLQLKTESGSFTQKFVKE